MREGEFMDWRVEFTYLNNFVKVVADYGCDNEEVFNRSICVQCVGCLCIYRMCSLSPDNEEVFNRAYATITNGALDINATFIVLDKPVAEKDADNIVNGALVWPSPPFELVFSFGDTSEVAKVTNIQTTADGRQNLTLERTNPVSFTQLGGVFPQDWLCPLSWYNDSQSCNCECGVPDPDCEAGKDLPVLACPLPYAIIDSGSFCSQTGHCVVSPPTSKDIVVKASQGCSKIWSPGDVLLRGFVGTEEAYRAATPRSDTPGPLDGCSPCPGDVHYDGQVMELCVPNVS